MERSATQQQAIELGKRLVALLGDEHTADALSRWMAHYIAEQMTAAENSRGTEKARAEERCFEAILNLWKHRASLPPGLRPFENFNAVFRALERLDPEEPRGYYHGFWREHQDKPEPGSVDAMVDFIVRLDDAARVLLEFALIAAVEQAADEESKAMLRDSVPIAADLELQSLARLMQFENRMDPRAEGNNTRALGRIRERIQALDSFEKACEGVREALQAELQRLGNSDAKDNA